MNGDEGNESVIYTDYEITKYHIWMAYNSFKEFYINWSMNVSRDKEKRSTSLGVRKHAEEFLIQISNFVSDKKLSKKIDDKDIEKVDDMMKGIRNGEFDPDDNDIRFIRLFAEEFLIKAGLKDITREKSDPGKAL